MKRKYSKAIFIFDILTRQEERKMDQDEVENALILASMKHRQDFSPSSSPGVSDVDDDCVQTFETKEDVESYINSLRQGCKLRTRDSKPDRLVRGCTHQNLNAPCAHGNSGNNEGCTKGKDKCMQKKHACNFIWVAQRGEDGRWFISEHARSHSCATYNGVEPCAKRSRPAASDIPFLGPDLVQDLRNHANTMRIHLQAIHSVRGDISADYAAAFAKYEEAHAKLVMAQSVPGSWVYEEARAHARLAAEELQIVNSCRN